MKVQILLDPASNAVDNSMQENIMQTIAIELRRTHEVEILNSGSKPVEEVCSRLLAQDYDILLTYNRSGTDIRDSDGVPVLSKISACNVAWLTEHPLCFHDKYLASQANRHFIFVNESHAAFAAHMSLQGSFSTSLFGSTVQVPGKQHRNRKFDVCVAAQWRGPAEANAFWLRENKATQDFFRDVVDLHDHEPNRDTFMAYLTAATARGIDIQAGAGHAVAMRAVYWYMRKLERIRMVQALVDSGLSVALIGGDSWKSVLRPSPRLTLLPACTHQAVVQWYRDARSIVCTNGYNGASERVFDAMSAGALVVSEDAPHLVSALEPSGAAFFYRPNRLHDRVGELAELIRSGRSQEMADSGRRLLVEGHTWQQRVEALGKVLEQLVAPQGCAAQA